MKYLSALILTSIGLQLTGCSNFQWGGGQPPNVAAPDYPAFGRNSEQTEQYQKEWIQSHSANQFLESTPEHKPW
jgi:hypothetical protein